MTGHSSSPGTESAMQRLLAAAGWDAGSVRHKQLEDALHGARLEIVDMTAPMTSREAQVRWARINNEPFEYAIQQGPHGDEFVKLLDGSCLHRAIPDVAQGATGPWSLHKQPADQIADHEYSIWLGDEPVIMANAMPGCGKYFSLLVDALNATPAQTAPDGWKLVPIEPTPAMHEAGYSVSLGPPEPMMADFVKFNAKIYKAMIESAPLMSSTDQGSK